MIIRFETSFTSVKVFIDDDYWRNIPRRLHKKLLSTKLPLDEDEWKTAVLVLEEKLAKEEAMQLLARSSQASFSLEKKLLDKGYTSESIRDAITICTDCSLIDDDSWIELFVDQNLKKFHGPRKIVYKLQTKGLPSEEAQEIVRRLVSVEKERMCILDFINRKGKGKDLKSLTETLMRRGFSPQYIHDISTKNHTSRNENASDPDSVNMSSTSFLYL